MRVYLHLPVPLFGYALHRFASYLAHDSFSHAQLNCFVLFCNVCRRTKFRYNSFYFISWKEFPYSYCDHFPVSFLFSIVQNKGRTLQLWFKIVKSLAKNVCFEWKTLQINIKLSEKYQQILRKYFALFFICGINWDNQWLMAVKKEYRMIAIWTATNIVAVTVIVATTLEN